MSCPFDIFCLCSVHILKGYLTVLAPPLSLASGADKISWTSLHQDETVTVFSFMIFDTN